jgi:hypothetical protein
MSNVAITYLVAAVSGVLGVAAFAGWVLVPAWASYSRPWQRAAATVMSLYVLAAMLGLGLLGGAAIVWFWDRIF